MSPARRTLAGSRRSNPGTTGGHQPLRLRGDAGPSAAARPGSCQPLGHRAFAASGAAAFETCSRSGASPVAGGDMTANAVLPAPSSGPFTPRIEPCCVRLGGRPAPEEAIAQRSAQRLLAKVRVLGEQTHIRLPPNPVPIVVGQCRLRASGLTDRSQARLTEEVRRFTTYVRPRGPSPILPAGPRPATKETCRRFRAQSSALVLLARIH